MPLTKFARKYFRDALQEGREQNRLSSDKQISYLLRRIAHRSPIYPYSYHNPGRQSLINRRLRQRIRSSVTWDQVVEACGSLVSSKRYRSFHRRPLGARPNTTGKFYMLCIFHSECTPSLVLWPDGGFFCFGCQIHGDVVDFAVAYRGLKTTRDIKRFFFSPAFPGLAETAS